jgi:pimeloyl-ACP methyl ester carboxylesterase
MPAKTRWTVGDVALVVKTWAAADDLHPPVVLVPATAETADDWDEIAPALALTRTVHAVNLRGHDGSDWPGAYSIRLMAHDVAGLLPQLSDVPVDMIAHSLGGLVACDVASAHPDLIRRIVLEDVGLLRPRATRVLTRPDGDLLFDWAMLEQVRPEVDDPDPRWTEVVAAIIAPILVIAGGPTSTMPQEQIADLARTARCGRITTIDAGHLVHATEPDAFLEAATDFLNRADGTLDAGND